jgi:two-component system OmpR family sensor kinase
MVADVERMQAMIGEVLSFARDAASAAELIDVRKSLAATVLDMDESGKALLLPGNDAWISAPQAAFRRSVENLLRNAIDYAGGCTLTVEHIDDSVTVSVADNGPGIPAADRERLLRPFERGDASRSRETGGAGLGLSIVRDFAAQHHGHFALTGAPDGGTIAILRLPAA